jgi:hypothetical protein
LLPSKQKMPVFGRAEFQTGLSNPAEIEGVKVVAVLTAVEASAILEVQTEVSIDASPNGASRKVCPVFTW